MAYDDSINQLRQAITFDASFVPSYVILCWALDAKDDTKAALDACKQALERQAIPWTTLALARAQALAGDHGAAVATLASLGNKQTYLFQAMIEPASLQRWAGLTMRLQLSKKAINLALSGCRT